MTQSEVGATGDPAPNKYIPHPGLIDAAEVAVELGLPLLLTGEPGTGKTECANWIAHKFGIKSVHKFVAKSTSVATDLFYVYDALSRFSSSQLGPFVKEERAKAADPKNFIDFSALGKAILYANEKKEILPFCSKSASTLEHPGVPQRSIVLIDEIDKAPKDFPNDLLDEIANMQFRVKELGNILSPSISDPRLRPIIVITSNSERQLPAPFLRRCAYFDIPFPTRRDDTRATDREETYFVEDIIAARLGHNVAICKLGKDAMAFFYHLRDRIKPPLSRKPATAELLNWMVALMQNAPNRKDGLSGNLAAANRAISLLLKNKADQMAGKKVLETWDDDKQG